MALESIFSFLTYPKKGKPEDKAAAGVAISLNSGKLYKMLRDIFDEAAEACDVQVMFTSPGEKQCNEVRNDLLAFAAKTTTPEMSKHAAPRRNANASTE